MTAGTDHVVDDLGDTEPFQYRPHRGHIPERQMAGAVRLTRTGFGQSCGDLVG